MVFLKADIRTRRMRPWAYRDSFILLAPTAQLGLALVLSLQSGVSCLHPLVSEIWTLEALHRAV